MTSLVSLALGLPLGLSLGFLGSLTGIGGGFLLMPALLILWPHESPAALSVVTLTVVLFNALSGTYLSLRKERVHLGLGLAYGLGALPLVWLGGRVQALVDRAVFLPAFGAFLVAGAVFLALPRPPQGEGADKRPPLPWHRGLAGFLASLAIGFASSFFGIGGGFLYVPLLALGLGLPVVEAAATGQLIVGLGAAFALVQAAGRSPLVLDSMLVSGLLAGVLVGAVAGTQAAGRVSGTAVLRTLALLLALVGLGFALSPW